MAFDDVIQHLDSTRVVAIITRRPDNTPAATPIWSVVVDGAPYLRSAFGPKSRWYRHALSGREIAFAMGDGKLAESDRAAALALPAEVVRVETVPAGDVIQSAIDEAISSKYASEPSSVTPMLSGEALECTLRVVAGA